MNHLTDPLEIQRIVRATELVEEGFRPSITFGPRLSIDGDQWCALHGENLQDGVAGFGDSPDEAYRAFDRAWYEKLPKRQSKSEGERG